MEMVYDSRTCCCCYIGECSCIPTFLTHLTVIIEYIPIFLFNVFAVFDFGSVCACMFWCIPELFEMLF